MPRLQFGFQFIAQFVRRLVFDVALGSQIEMNFVCRVGALLLKCEKEWDAPCFGVVLYGTLELLSVSQRESDGAVGDVLLAKDETFLAGDYDALVISLALQRETAVQP